MTTLNKFHFTLNSPLGWFVTVNAPNLIAACDMMNVKYKDVWEECFTDEEFEQKKAYHFSFGVNRLAQLTIEESTKVIGKAYHFDGLCCMVEDMRNDCTVNTDGSITDGNGERLNLFWWADTECYKLGRMILVEDENSTFISQVKENLCTRKQTINTIRQNVKEYCNLTDSECREIGE